MAGLNALVYRFWGARSGEGSLGARTAAVLSLLLWTAVITCGRFIAYV